MKEDFPQNLLFFDFLFLYSEPMIIKMYFCCMSEKYKFDDPEGIYFVTGTYHCSLDRPVY